MRFLSRRSLLLGGITISAFPKSEPEQVYLFATSEYEIRMTLEFHDQYHHGLRFQDRHSDRHFCLSPQGDQNRNCVSDFTGAITVARYKISPRGALDSSPSLREYVRSIDQSDSLPARPPFERIIQSQHGLASDIQVFGYQDSSHQNVQTPDPDDAWCLLRQDLYLKDKIKPFLVLHWKHTLSSIRILDMIPENGTSQVTQHR